MSNGPQIRGTQIKDGTITEDDIGTGAVKVDELSSEVISEQTEITEVDAVNDRLLILDNTDGSLKKIAPENISSGGSPLTTTAITISGSSDTPFAIYNAGDTSPMFMVDTSSSWDGAPRVTIRQANDHGREDTAFPSPLTNADAGRRGVLHIEREMSEGDYDTVIEENLPLISAHAIGDGTQAGQGADGGDAIFRLISWGGESKIQMYSSADAYDATSIGGKRPLAGQSLGELEFGGYKTNGGPLRGAKLYVEATETWYYSNRNGTRYIFEACRTNSGISNNVGYGQIGRFSHNEGWNAIAPPLSIAETGSMVAGTTINGDNFASYMFASDHANSRMVMVVNDESGSIQEMNLPYTIGEDVAGLSTSVSQLGSDLQTLSGSVSTNASNISSNSTTIASNEGIIGDIRDAVNAAVNGDDLLNQLKAISWPT